MAFGGFGLSTVSWNILILLFWPIIWTLFGIYILRPVAEYFIENWLENRDEGDPEKFILHLRYIGILFFIMTYPAIMITVMWKRGIISYLFTDVGIAWSAVIGFIAFFGGSKFAGKFLSGAALLMDSPFSRTNFIETYSDYKKIFGAWVLDIGTHKTKLLDEDFSVWSVDNDKLLDYSIKNKDSGPFHHAIIKIPYNNRNPMEMASNIMTAVSTKTNNNIYKPSDSTDKEWFKQRLGEDVSEKIWKNFSGIRLDITNKGYLIFRAPVRDYIDELNLKHSLIQEGFIPHD